MINVTKSFLPDKEAYIKYIDQIWDNVQLTNNGPLLQELEQKLNSFLGIDNLLFCANGTVVLQIALKVFNITGEVITTPFSYCATSNSILWASCKPVFVDISPDDFNIDPDLIEAAITPSTQAIVATHVYGNPCHVEKIKSIAEKHNLKVIYDGAHAFGVKLNGKSIFSFGDISTCSFHATKVFHSTEGGALVTNTAEAGRSELNLLRAFGHQGDENYYTAGINGKNSEFHAAMGLCNLPHVPDIIASRRNISERYDQLLNWSLLSKPSKMDGLEYNYAYYPVVFPNEQTMKKVQAALNAQDIFPRRYFYPSLNTLPFMPEYYSCPVSEAISLKVLCLPLFVDLSLENVDRISQIINENLT
jgi:dTDP-4-amino-4,6-dideoxygalactose transaminase